jgi:peptidoglycan/LPS O-acetylase OafA/YrhL
MRTIGLGGLFLFEEEFYKALHEADMLLLTVSAVCLIIEFNFQHRGGDRAALVGTAWLRSFGRRSYEIYLTHMFVVFSLVYMFKVTGGKGEHPFGVPCQ